MTYFLLLLGKEAPKDIPTVQSFQWLPQPFLSLIFDLFSFLVSHQLAMTLIAAQDSAFTELSPIHVNLSGHCLWEDCP